MVGRWYGGPSVVVRKIAAQRGSGYAEQMPRAANEQFSMELKLLSVAFEDVGDGFVANQILLNEELLAVFKFFLGAPRCRSCGWQ